MVPPANKPAPESERSPRSSADPISTDSGVASVDVVPSSDTPPTRDTLRDTDVATTDLSVQHRTDPTLLSNTKPADSSQSQLEDRVRDLELKQDALVARVRLLEKGGANPLPLPGAWLLFLPLVAFLWWLVQRLGN